MSTIVITGGAGFIGSHIAESCVKEGHDVTIVDNLSDYYSPEAKKKNIEYVYRQGKATFVQGDITDGAFVRKVIHPGIDYIFHEAAQPGVRISVENPFFPNQINVLGTLNVLQAAREAGVKRVINASSSSVYGKVSYLPFDEKHPTLPVSPYGVSKLAAEHYCRVFSEIYNLPTVSLRYFTVYGPRMRPDLAIAQFTEKMVKNEPVIIFGDGNQTRDFTYIDDIVRINLSLLSTSRADGKVLNVGGGHRISINELVKKLKMITGSSSAIVYQSAKKGDAEHTMSETDLAKTLLNFSPQTDIDSGLKKYVDWYRNQR